jgi:hypothetical protein
MLASLGAPDASVVEARMHDHAAHGAAMRDAVARADLEAARREAASLASLRSEVGGESFWGWELGAMRLAARELAGAKDLPAASRDLAGVARTCGDCHVTLGRPPAVVIGEPPPDLPGVSARMLRHHWAAVRLWDGLVVPSDAAWRSGADVLSDAPMTPPELPPPAIGELAASVHELGRRARFAESDADRSALYGALMATCADCHARMKRPLASR